MCKGLYVVTREWVTLVTYLTADELSTGVFLFHSILYSSIYQGFELIVKLCNNFYHIYLHRISLSKS